MPTPARTMAADPHSHGRSLHRGQGAGDTARELIERDLLEDRARRPSRVAAAPPMAVSTMARYLGSRRTTTMAATMIAPMSAEQEAP